MAAGFDDQAWQSFLDHDLSIGTILDIHTALLTKVQDGLAEGSPILDLVKMRLFTTQTFRSTLGHSSGSLKEAMRREKATPKPETMSIPVMPLPTPSVPTQPMVDPSGLFSVDPNPTPVDQLIQETTVKGKSTSKRKFNGEELQPNNDTGLSEGESRQKRAKRNTEAAAPAQPDEDEDDSFIRRVEAKGRMKEQRKRARSEKKRKRQSNSSINGGSTGPKNKKQKQAHGVKQASKSSLDVQQNQNGKRSIVQQNGGRTQNGRPNKKRKKSKS